MSRGHGVVQRQVLAQLKDAKDWVSLRELAGNWTNRSRFESTRRAVDTLRMARVVETEMRTVNRGSYGFRQLYVRLPKD